MWAPSGEPWPGARHSCYVAGSWKSLWCLPGNSATQGYLPLGANPPAQFQCCAAAGAGESGKQPHLNFIPIPFVCASFFLLGRSFLDWLFCRNIRPVGERLLLCFPGSTKHSFFFPFHLIPLFLRHKSEYSNFPPELSPLLLLICILNHI